MVEGEIAGDDDKGEGDDDALATFTVMPNTLYPMAADNLASETALTASSTLGPP